jgi:hypothetical protein
MINLNESTFFFIIFLTGIVSYVIFICSQNCDIKCKINYYKYENYYKNEISQDLSYRDLNDNNISTNNDIVNDNNDDEYLKNIFDPNLF